MNPMFSSSVSYIPAAKYFLYQTSGRRPPHITGRVVNTTVTSGWVGAPIERVLFRFMTS